jgi:pilus assembly protein CpaF
VVIPPVALGGPTLTIRKFSRNKLTADDLISAGALSGPMMALLRACVQLRKNMIISGGTGTGKTTLLNVISSFIPADERILTIEDSAELRLPQEHVVRLESRRASVEGTGEITIRHLVTNALRMRPDRIIVGECRAGETLDMLQAMNTGHDGSLSTVHANSPRDAISRIATLVLMAGTELPEKAIREQISSAIQVIIQLSRLSDGSRKVTDISEVCGIANDRIVLVPLFTFKRKGIVEGKVIGDFSATGDFPTFFDEAETHGIALDKMLFERGSNV